MVYVTWSRATVQWKEPRRVSASLALRLLLLCWDLAWLQLPQPGVNVPCSALGSLRGVAARRPSAPLFSSTFAPLILALLFPNLLHLVLGPVPILVDDFINRPEAPFRAQHDFLTSSRDADSLLPGLVIRLFDTQTPPPWFAALCRRFWRASPPRPRLLTPSRRTATSSSVRMDRSSSSKVRGRFACAVARADPDQVLRISCCPKTPSSTRSSAGWMPLSSRTSGPTRSASTTSTPARITTDACKPWQTPAFTSSSTSTPLAPTSSQ